MWENKQLTNRGRYPRRAKVFQSFRVSGQGLGKSVWNIKLHKRLSIAEVKINTRKTLLLHGYYFGKEYMLIFIVLMCTCLNIWGVINCKYNVGQKWTKLSPVCAFDLLARIYQKPRRLIQKNRNFDIMLILFSRISFRRNNPSKIQTLHSTFHFWISLG